MRSVPGPSNTTGMQVSPCVFSSDFSPGVPGLFFVPPLRCMSERTIHARRLRSRRAHGAWRGTLTMRLACIDRGSERRARPWTSRPHGAP